jgi:hypothetical protein
MAGNEILVQMNHSEKEIRETDTETTRKPCYFNGGVALATKRKVPEVLEQR